MASAVDDPALGALVAPAPTLTNWAATFSATPEAYFEPRSAAEARAVLARAARARGVVRVIGAGHSPNDSALCAGAGSAIVSLRRMAAVHSVDAATGLVACGGGATLAALNAALHAAGLALPNLGSISDQTIAGAMATGTHGTGLREGALSMCVRALELVTPGGEVLELSAAGPTREAFRGALCSLGALGIITRVTLQAVPAFDLRVEEAPARWDEVLASLPARAASAPFYRFWWFPHTERVWEWRAHPVAPAPPPPAPRGVLGALRARWDWLWDMGVGFHALQALLRVALWVPALVPPINALYAFTFYRKPRSHTARSDLAFNFNCLFKQCVRLRAAPSLFSFPRLHAARPPHYTPLPGTFQSGRCPWRRCTRRSRACAPSSCATMCARTFPSRCAFRAATTRCCRPRTGARRRGSASLRTGPTAPTTGSTSPTSWPLRSSWSGCRGGRTGPRCRAWTRRGWRAATPPRGPPLPRCGSAAIRRACCSTPGRGACWGCK